MLQAQSLPRVKIELATRCYEVRLAEQTCRFYKAPLRAVKVVAVEHLRGSRDPEAFYSTVQGAEPQRILSWYSRRTCGEAGYRDVKQHLGAGQGQGRTRGAALRMTPMALWLYSLVTLWHEWARPAPAVWLRRWKGKVAPSFADMLAALRLECLRASRGAAETSSTENFCASSSSEDAQKYVETLERLIALAA
jgi:hypothetical protein